MNKEEKLNRLKEINLIIEPLSYERSRLDEDIRFEEFDEFCNRAKDYDWFLEGNKLYLDKDKKKQFDKFFIGLFPHNSYSDRDYNYYINGDDGDIFLSFANEELMFIFIDKYNLRIVNLDEIQGKINQMKDDLDMLNKRIDKTFNLLTKLTLIELNKRNKR